MFIKERGKAARDDEARAKKQPQKNQQDKITISNERQKEVKGTINGQRK